MRRLGLWALAGLFLIACGDDEKSASQKCRDMANTFCERAAFCAADADLLEEGYTRAELKMDCSEALDEVLDCDAVVATGDNYADCISDLKTFSCEVSNDALLEDPPRYAEPPDSCDEAVLR